MATPAQHPPAQHHWRHELDGLRAIAIALVICFHFWGAGVSGGVDVFFVLSGYLVVQTVTGRLTSPQGFKLASYWSRTMYRLWLPLGVLLCVVAILSAIMLPASRWSELVPQLRASAVGVQNWWLAHTAVDYYAARSVTTSPVQHLWSVSLQGQVFVVLPVLVVISWQAAKRLGKPSLPAVAMALGLATVVSAWHAVVAVAHQPVPTYFWFSTRFWEFTLGGLAALVPAVATSRLSSRVADGVAWLALTVILVGPFVWSADARFPGPVAAIPACAAAAFLSATRRAESTQGPPPRDLSSVRWLGARPFRVIGRQAFGVYLWHWPLLVFYTVSTGQKEVSPLAGGLIVTVAFLAATTTSHLVAALERPLQSLPVGKPLGMAVMAVVTAVAVTGTNVWQTIQLTPPTASSLAAPSLAGPSSSLAQAHSSAPKSYPSLLASPSPTATPTRIVPGPADLKATWFEAGPKCTLQIASAPIRKLEICRSTGSAASQTSTWALVGDSHIQQFGHGIAEVAAQHNASLRTYLLGGCRYPDFPKSGRNFPDCRNFVRDVRRELKTQQPDVVFLVGTRGIVEEPGEQLVPGIAEAAQELADLGMDVVLVRDNPRFSSNPYECGELRGWDSHRCVNLLRAGVPTINPLTDVAAQDPRIHAVDHLQEICPKRRCAPTQGNVAVFIDDNHLSGEFSASLAPSLQTQLVDSGLLSQADNS